ncbi:MAG: glutamate--tRNA ligase [Candidatus Dependentiae bacterium]|nr:glutamate--tRNA ligase [Candidatus Dependentiae bacterium]
MKNSTIRVRFAPAPTGMMHLGNVRTALMNYLFAKQKEGTYIIRIEDTDTQRNYDPTAEKIIEDLTWLGLHYDEGPIIGGPDAPYFQSLRTPIYQEKLSELFNKSRAYRCFCTPEDLEKKRERQIALKMPPRYDRTCAKLSEAQLNEHLAKKTLFVWRVKLETEGHIAITDMAHGVINFNFKNFSDFPLTRQDETFTFIFANFVDDLVMNMTHVIRGEDHLTNTANQAMLYQAFQAPLPIFWHLPILCNIEGKKLSKRDFGFSLRDLRAEGFLPEAICNYLAIIGGSFKEEIMSLEQLAKLFNFDNMHTTGHIKYDVEKLHWINRKWITLYNDETLANLCLPYLLAAYPTAKLLDQKVLARLIQIIKTDLNTLKDVTQALDFYFEAPKVTHQDVVAAIDAEHAITIATILVSALEHINDVTTFVQTLKTASQTQNIPLKEMFTFIRMALMGKPKGPGIHELVEMLGVEEITQRFNRILS